MQRFTEILISDYPDLREITVEYLQYFMNLRITNSLVSCTFKYFQVLKPFIA